MARANRTDREIIFRFFPSKGEKVRLLALNSADRGPLKLGIFGFNGPRSKVHGLNSRGGAPDDASPSPSLPPPRHALRFFSVTHRVYHLGDCYSQVQR